MKNSLFIVCLFLLQSGFLKGQILLTTPNGTVLRTNAGTIFQTPTVTIGSQKWAYFTVNVGVRIATNQEMGDNGVIEKYCYNNLEANCVTYGGLYQWAEAVQYQNGATNTAFGTPHVGTNGNVQGICPSGWHIPTDAEWATLVATLGGSATAGGKLKEAGTVHWLDPNTGANNSSGFTALPAGVRASGGTCVGINQLGYFWSSTESAASAAYYYKVGWSGPTANRASSSKVDGQSVRCVMD